MKVGNYVRTKTGLGKITEYKKHDSWGYIVKVEGTYNCYTHTGNGELSDVIKFSPNIIDLIEVGDYVNGHRVIEVDLDDIDDYGNTFKYIKTEYDYSLNYWVKENEIETIVAKEQFESMEYKVGELDER